MLRRYARALSLGTAATSAALGLPMTWRGDGGAGGGEKG